MAASAELQTNIKGLCAIVKMPGVQIPTVTATVNYAQRPPPGEKLEAFLGKIPDGHKPLNVQPDPHDVSIANFRSSDFGLQTSLQAEGFKLVSLPVSKDILWESDEQVTMAIT